MLDIKKALSEIFAWINGNKDYVVEQGTSGIWTYRKWNSGIAECFGRYQGTETLSASNPISSGKAWSKTIVYPFTFAAIPNVSAAGAIGSGYAIVAREYRRVDALQIFVYTSMTTATSNVDFGFYVVGKWK